VPWNSDVPVFAEDVEGSTRPAEYYLAESRDGLYVPYVLRTPANEGRFPFVFLAYGNGGGGIGWLRQWVYTRSYIMERLLAAGYACAWGRYRTEVDLGFNRGGPLMVDGRQGMELMNRSPLEFEDEVAILEHVRRHPQVDAGNLAHFGVSHAGEMLFKLSSLYPGMLRAGVASEPANHEFLDLRLDDIAPVNAATGLRRRATPPQSRACSMGSPGSDSRIRQIAADHVRFVPIDDGADVAVRPDQDAARAFHSHSMVAGGFEEMS